MQFHPVPTLQDKPLEEFVDGTRLYQRNCSDCHGPLATSRKKGISFSQFSSAITRQSPMKKAGSLNREEQQAIVDALQ